MFFGHHFFGEYDYISKLIFMVNSCSPWIYLSNDVSCASNGNSMSKLRPQEIDVPIYPKGAHIFDVSSPRVRILDV